MHNSDHLNASILPYFLNSSLNSPFMCILLDINIASGVIDSIYNNGIKCSLSTTRKSSNGTAGTCFQDGIKFF